MKHDVVPEIQKSEEEWRAQLGPDRYHILREAGTEAPFTGSLLHVNDNGTYTCGACGLPLFTADSKFDSHCGWPSFTTPKNRRTSASSTTIATACIAPRCAANAVIHTLATSSTMVPARREPAIA